MTWKRRSGARMAAALGLAAAVAAGGSGCESLPNPVPAANTDLTLARLDEIQNDERLTDEEKEQMVRDLVGAGNDEAGDRLVTFLLNFNVP